MTELLTEYHYRPTKNRADTAETNAWFAENGVPLKYRHKKLLLDDSDGAVVDEMTDDGIVVDKITDDEGYEEKVNPVDAFARFTARDEKTTLSVGDAFNVEADDLTARDGYTDVAFDEDASEPFAAMYTLLIERRARKALHVVDLAANAAFVEAVLSYDFPRVNTILIDTVRNKEASYALRVACIGALRQIAPYADTDDGGELNDAWLSRITGIARSCCKELFDAWLALGTDIAELLIGTEHGEGRGDVRAFIRENGERLDTAAEALKQYHTFAMIEHAGKFEKTARERKISLSDLDVLDSVGMNNREGREQLAAMPLKLKQVWLADMLNQTEAWATRTGGIVATAKSAAEPKKSKLVKPPAKYKFTGRLLTKRQLHADNVYEL
jgi:hypothetical protein